MTLYAYLNAVSSVSLMLPFSLYEISRNPHFRASAKFYGQIGQSVNNFCLYCCTARNCAIAFHENANSGKVQNVPKIRSEGVLNTFGCSSDISLELAIVWEMSIRKHFQRGLSSPLRFDEPERRPLAKSILRKYPPID